MNLQLPPRSAFLSLQSSPATFGRLLRPLLLGFLSCLQALVHAEDKPLWDLSTNALVSGLCAGQAEKVDGRVVLRNGAAFAVPAEAFPDQRNFTVQVTLSVNELAPKSLCTFMSKQTSKDDGFDFSIMNVRDTPGNYFIHSSVNKILMESWMALGKNWPELNAPVTFNLAVRNGYATFYQGDKPIKSALMEVIPNAEPMWIGRGTDPRAGHLPVTIHDVKVYGPEHKFVSQKEEASSRKTVGGRGWAMDVPKSIEHPEWPKVLIYGDSISGGYRPPLEAELTKRNVHLFHFVGFVGGEVPEKAISEAAASYKFDVIVFNNGLHSLSWTKEAVADEVVSERMRRLAQSFKKGAPQARLFYLATTPHTGRRPAEGQPVNTLGEKNEVVVRLNTLSAQVMKQENIEWIDAYSLLASRLDLASGDNFHWQRPAYDILSQEVATAVLRYLKK